MATGTQPTGNQQDIFMATSNTAIHNGSIVVNGGGPGMSLSFSVNSTPAKTIPVVTGTTPATRPGQVLSAISGAYGLQNSGKFFYKSYYNV